MSEKHELKKTTRSRSLAKGLMAGLVGGLVATAAKRVAEKVYPPRIQGEPEAPLLVEKPGGHELVPAKKDLVALQWGFGALTGAAYGAVVEYYPPASAKDGAGFGMALSSITHDTVLPAMGLSADPGLQTGRERSSEIAMHMVYGVVTETVRRIVRRMLG
jgi:putative membrane protein